MGIYIVHHIILILLIQNRIIQSYFIEYKWIAVSIAFIMILIFSINITVILKRFHLTRKIIG